MTNRKETLEYIENWTGVLQDELNNKNKQTREALLMEEQIFFLRKAVKLISNHKRVKGVSL